MVQWIARATTVALGFASRFLFVRYAHRPVGVKHSMVSGSTQPHQCTRTRCVFALLTCPLSPFLVACHTQQLPAQPWGCASAAVCVALAIARMLVV